MGPQPEIRVNGRPLAAATTYGDLEVTHRWPGGCWETTFAVPTKRYRRVPGLVVGARVQVFEGYSCVWAGTLDEPDVETGQMVASGLIRQGEQAIALAANGTLSTQPDPAVDQAIARGAVSWRRPTSFFAEAFSDATRSAAPVYLNPLLAAVATTKGRGYGVNPRDELYTVPDPTPATNPTIVVMPDSGEMGIAEETKAGSIVGRYFVDSATYTNVRVGTAAPEIGVSLAKLGVITQARAEQVITALLAQVQARRGWTNGLILAASQITTLGGAPVSLASVRANGYGLMRLAGVRDERGRSADTTAQLGETVWRPAEGTVLANPIGLVARDLTSIIADAGGELLSGL